MFFVFFLFFLDFGLSRLTSLQFIQYHLAGFYKPTIPQSPPSHLRDHSTCNNARLEFSTIFCSKLWWSKWMVPEKWSSGGLNPGHLGHESSALTTRPQLLALIVMCYVSWETIYTIKSGVLKLFCIATVSKCFNKQIMPAPWCLLHSFIFKIYSSKNIKNNMW